MYECSLLPAALFSSARSGWAKTASSTIAKHAPLQNRHFCFCFGPDEGDSETFSVRVGTGILRAAASFGELSISKMFLRLGSERNCQFLSGGAPHARAVSGVDPQ